MELAYSLLHCSGIKNIWMFDFLFDMPLLALCCVWSFNCPSLLWTLSFLFRISICIVWLVLHPSSSSSMPHCKGEPLVFLPSFSLSISNSLSPQSTLHPSLESLRERYANTNNVDSIQFSYHNSYLKLPSKLREFNNDFPEITQKFDRQL